MKKRILSLLLALIMVLGMLPVTAFAADAPVSVTADGGAVTVSHQGDYSDAQWGWYTIPVYYAQVSEDATISIDCSDGAEATYRPGDGYLGYLSELQGMTKDSLQPYFTTASSYGLTTTNNVAYIEILDYYYGSIYGVLIELVPASASTTTYEVTLPEGEGYTVAASGDSVSPVAAGGSYSFTVTVSDDYDGTNMVVKANDTALTAVDGVYTITDIQADQNVTVSGVEKKYTGPVSVTADNEAVTVSHQGDYSDAQWGWYTIPVYYAQVSEDATISIDCSDGAEATYRPGDGYLGYPSELQGLTKDSLQPYFTTASNYNLTTTNNVAYIEILDYYYGSIYGLLIELVPAPDGGDSGSGDSGSTTSEKLTGITGTASSTNEEEGAVVSNAFDGDYGTYWATAAGGSLEDSYLIADLGGTYTINKVEYTKRYDSSAGYNCTGNLLNYVIEVSTDGETWTKVAEGETIDGTTVIEFEPVQAAYVRLTSTSSYHWNSAQTNTVMCAAELAVFRTKGGNTDTPTPTTYTVTLPSGEGYTAAASGESASPVAAGSSYSFTVTVADDYDDTNMVVKANDTVLTAVNGVYTIENISADQVITVTGVEKKAVPLISVTVGGEACELTTLGNYESSIRFKTDEIPVYMISADEGETIVVSKGANGDGASLSYRRLWKYGASSSDFTEVNYYDNITVPVTSTYAINSNADAMAKFDLTTSNPVYYVEIGTNDDGSPLYGLLVEVIPAAPANTYTVTLPTGEGYSAAASGDSASPVAEGGSYSFTVAVVYGYDGTNMVVKANDTVLTAVNGVYTIENITANQEVTVTGVTKTVEIDPSDYITVIVENTSGDGSVLLKPMRLLKEDYVNDYVTPTLQQAMGSSNVKYGTTWDDNGSLTSITGIYDASQDDSYLNNGDVDGYRWQVLINNEAWSGRDYNKDYKLKGGDVIRCIYTSEAVEDVAGGVSKDDLIQLAADVSDEIKTTQAYQDALDTIVSDTATEEDVQNAITALQNAQVVKATSVEITAGESVDLKVNSSLTLQAAILPANATDVPVWSSADNSVVSVDAATGEITGVAAGTATVTVTCGSVSDSIQVNVTAVEAESVTITNGDVSVEARFSVQLAATITPENSTELVVWSVADESIATVDASGKLTGVSVGETTVTATAGTVSHTVKVTVTETTSTYVYFQYTDGRVQEMKEDTFTLTVLDEGSFVVGNTTAAATWSCSEYVSNDDGTNQYNYWISSSGKYQPHDAKDMTATVNAGGYYKTFTIKTVPSGISQIKAYIDDKEKNADNPYELTGMANAVVAVYGLNEAGDWVYIPIQALKIASSDTNIVRFLGNQMSLIREGSADITISMLDNSEVATSFQAVCNTVQVTGIDVVVPETFYIDKWDSMGNVFVGIYQGYEDPNTQYHVYYTPSNATNQDLIWEDLTPEIAEYDEGWSTGIVPKKAGTAKFKVTSVSNPEVSQEVTINFEYKTPLESAVCPQETYEMNVGDSLDPGLIFTPSNATETRFNWTYSQNGIVQVKETVTSSGYTRVVNRKIIALANGTVTVTGTPVDDTAGCQSVTFTVTVGSAGETETIDYLKMAKEDIAHGLEYLQGQSQTSYGNEWTIFTNLRAGGYMDPQLRIIYLQSVADELKNYTEDKQPTDYARVVLTLPLLDADPENLEGLDLVEKLYNANLENQTSNQICWTLLALDSRNYEIPEDALWNREKLIARILTFQNSDGSFALYSGGSGDVDMTGMVLQSLAPYYDSNAQVQSAVNKALEYLKAQMTENVGYINGGAENSCTAAQVLTALAALRIDPTDPDNGFTLGTKNLITNLRSFRQNSGFAYLLGEDTNLMGTQQTTYALEAYRRYAEGQSALYDLTDLDGEAEIVTYEVTLPAGEGYTAEAADGSESLVATGGRYTFTVTLADGYTKDENFAVKANGVALTEEEGKYTIKNIRADQVITVEGVRKVLENETFTVSLPTGEGYVVKAADGSKSPVEYDGSYSFTVTIAEGYEKTGEFAVKVNGTTLTAKDGKYTIENIRSNQTVTVTGVREKVDTITVRFSLLGCYKHSDGETAVHTLVDGNLQTWIGAKDYEVPADSTVKDILETVLSQNGMTSVNPDGNYVKYIVKDGIRIGEFTNGTLSGWMYTLNGVHSGLGVAEQKLKDGDVVVFHYTDDYTRENSTSGSEDDENIVAAVEALINAIGEVTLDSEEKITEAREAYNALTDAQKVQVENYQTLIDAEAAYAQLIKTEEDEEAAKAVEEKIAAIGTVTPDSEEAIQAAREAYDALTETQKALVDNYAVLTAAEETLKLLKLSNADILNIYQTTGDYLAGLSAPVVGSTNGEWRVIGLARAGRSIPDSYYEAVAKYVQDNINESGRLHEAKSTDNSRMIVALTAIGKDVTDVAGFDLLSGLNDMAYIGNQGINGTIWALIAFDSHDYEIPAGDVTREKLVEAIVDAQLADGGWALSGVAGDPDMTGMALQALAPYYNTNSGARAAIDKALTWLSGIQNQDGTFSGSEGTTSESLAQVITALTALGINPETDSRFIKNGVSAVDALSAFYVDGGGFKHSLSGERNMMATEQGYYALVSYYRLLQDKTSLYDMSDVTIQTAAKDQEKADEVEALIDAIGTVTAESGEAIETARKAYDALTDAQKELVENYKTLTDAEKAYAQIVKTAADEAAAKAVEDKIDAIGTVTLDSEDAIEEARAAYEKLTAIQKALVSNLDKLEAAEKALADLKNEAAANEVEELISAIGTVTLDSENKIKAARKAYDALTEAQKKLVENYKTLTDAESKLNELKSTVSVTFTLLGCSKHGTDKVHTLADGNLSTWISTKTYMVVPGATVKDVLDKALAEAGMSCSNPTGNYVESINGIGEFTNGSNSGWMYTLNGTHPNLGVSEQTVKAGDVIVFHYTDDYTKEEGSQGYVDRDEAAAEKVEKLIDAIGTVTVNSKSKIDAARKAYDALTYTQKRLVGNYATLTAAEARYAQLKAADDEKKASSVEDLIDAIMEGSTTFEVDVKAAQNAYNNLTADQKKLVDNYYKLADYLKELADEEDKEAAEAVEKLIEDLGNITPDSEDDIEAAREAYEKLTDEQKALVGNLDALEAAEEKLAELKTLAGVEDIYKTTGDYLEALGTPVPGSVGGEWMVIGLSRSDREVPGVDDYYDSVVKYVQENIDENERLHSAKSTDNSRLILALTAIGKDVTNVDGHNLLTGLNSMEFIQKQGINGPIWALIAFDSGNYPIPAGDVTREALIQVILDAQLADGGWALSGETSDSDMTGMAVQALAPYYETNVDVKEALDEAVETMSRMQAADGSFGSIDGTSSESISQIIVALAALGIDANKDERFIKNGVSALDALCAFYVDGGGFRHIPDGKLDGMATEQGYYALTAYFRMLDGKTGLYNMTDMIDMGGDAGDEPVETLPAETEPALTEPVDTQENKSGFPWWIIVVILIAGVAVVVIVPAVKKKFGAK
ncbi:MAG: DUF4430 domain-containing protein [Oscillospiraceae bacterium]|nr:DUF4430 domain-containing protein [Oscillospiraceae bacterium]